jgi:hypothetical protein
MGFRHDMLGRDLSVGIVGRCRDFCRVLDGARVGEWHNLLAGHWLQVVQMGLFVWRSKGRWKRDEEEEGF